MNETEKEAILIIAQFLEPEWAETRADEIVRALRQEGICLTPECWLCHGTGIAGAIGTCPNCAGGKLPPLPKRRDEDGFKLAPGMRGFPLPEEYRNALPEDEAVKY